MPQIKKHSVEQLTLDVEYMMFVINHRDDFDSGLLHKNEKDCYCYYDGCHCANIAAEMVIESVLDRI